MGLDFLRSHFATKMRPTILRLELDHPNLCVNSLKISAKEAEQEADYLKASVLWGIAAHTYPESLQSKRIPLMDSMLRCEDLYLEFLQVAKYVEPRFAVGKKMRNAVYLHHSHDWAIDRTVLESAKQRLEDETGGAYLYNLIKWNRANDTITFLWVPSFNSVDEPALVDWYIVPADPTVKVKCVSSGDNPPIYHWKWLFVDHNYDGFDLSRSIHRSVLFRTLKVDRGSLLKMGRRDYWEANLKPLLDARMKEFGYG